MTVIYEQVDSSRKCAKVVRGQQFVERSKSPMQAMPKLNRKRKHDKNDEFEIIAPKNKFKPFDEKAQAEEEKLTKILFGGSSSFLQSLEEAEQEAGPSRSNVDSGVGETDSEDSDQKEYQPVWIDEDDGIEVGTALDAQGRTLPKGGVNTRTNEYSTLLKHKYTSIVGTPKWASLDKTNYESDDEILQTCGFVKKTAKKNLPANTLEYKKVKDLNCETYNEGPFVNCIEFHPTSSVSLVAGSSGVASLFAVDGKGNNKLHSVVFEKYPIMCAKFINNGNEAILGSRHSHIFNYDLIAAKATRMPLPYGLTQCKNFVISPGPKVIAVAGKFGEVHLLSSTSKERIALLKQDSEVTSLSFNPQGDLLYGHSDTGEVTIWDVNMRRVKHKWIDEGCIQGTRIAVASTNQFVATGSAQGVVNLYSTKDLMATKTPKPKRSVLNLTTGIADLKFNPSSEILAFSTSDIESSARLLHLESLSVFSNFPNFGTKLGHICTVNFSPGSGYFALGNKKSTVSLYRLKHFKNY